MFEFFIKHNKSVKQDVLAGITAGIYLGLEIFFLTSFLEFSATLILFVLGLAHLFFSRFLTAKGSVWGVSRATLLLVIYFTKNYDFFYLPLVVILSGFFQVIIGRFKLGKFIRLVPRSVYLGFLNGG